MKNQKFAVLYLMVFFLVGVSSLSFSSPDNEELNSALSAVVTKNCTTCHSGPNPASKLDLSPDNILPSTISIISTQKKGVMIIVPGEPKNSYLYQKIFGDSEIEGKRMPFQKDPLEKSDIKLIKKWIKSLIELSPSPTPKNKKSFKSADVFFGTQLINLPTTTTIPRKHVLFKISHRFEPTVESGSETFYGWDGPANILFSLGYGITSKMDIAISRSNRWQELEILYKWRIFDLGYFKNLPLNMSLGLGANWIGQEISGRDRNDTRNLRYFVQINVGWPVLRYLSLIIAPTFISNIDHLTENAENMTVLNTGFNIKIFRGFSLLGEWSPVLSGPAIDESGWGFGFQYITGKHIFHLTVSNSAGLTTGQYLRGSTQYGDQGNIRFGFNIFREF